MKKQGHYCKICGEYKANEKFTGKGHASHICKKCHSLSQDERNSQAMITRIMNLPYRLSKDQTEWLKKLRKDRRPEVSECAEEAYEMRFPYAERNERKDQLHIRLLEFHVCGEMYDCYGDTYDICANFTVDKQKHTIVREQNESSETVTLDSKEMNKLLRRMIHSYEVFCWNEDYEDDDEVIESDIHEEAVTWRLHIEYSNGEVQDMQSCEEFPFRVIELVQDLLDYFDDEDDYCELDEDDE